MAARDRPPDSIAGPRWLVGDWNEWVRDPVDLLRLALLLAIVPNALLGSPIESLRLALTFIVTLLPRALNVPRLIDLAFVCGMSFQAWGNVSGAFNGIYGYDKVVHFVLPAGTASLLYLLLVRLQVVPDVAHERRVRPLIAVAIATIAFGVTVGGFYEMYEWFAIHVLGAGLFANYGDTVGDLGDDVLGAGVGALLLVAWYALGGGSQRRPTGDRLDRATRTMQRGLASLAAAVALPEGPGHKPRAGEGERGRLARWLGEPFVRAALDLLRLALLAGALTAAAEGNASVAVRMALTFLMAVGVRWAAVPPAYDLLFVAAMSFQAWAAFAGVLGSSAYASAAHACVALSLGPVLYFTLLRLHAYLDIEHRPGVHWRLGVPCEPRIGLG